MFVVLISEMNLFTHYLQWIMPAHPEAASRKNEKKEWKEGIKDGNEGGREGLAQWGNLPTSLQCTDADHLLPWNMTHVLSIIARHCYCNINKLNENLSTYSLRTGQNYKLKYTNISLPWTPRKTNKQTDKQKTLINRCPVKNVDNSKNETTKVSCSVSYGTNRNFAVFH